MRVREHIRFARQAPGQFDRPHVVEENDIIFHLVSSIANAVCCEIDF